MSHSNNFESDSDSDIELNVLPYQFESELTEDDSSSTEDSLNSSRLGNADW